MAQLAHLDPEVQPLAYISSIPEQIDVEYIRYVHIMHYTKVTPQLHRERLVGYK